MNPIEPIKKLPDLDWTEHARYEIAITGEELVDQSDFIWRVGGVAAVGFIYTSLVCPPWMWFVLSKNVTIGDLVDFRRLARAIPKGTLTSVAEDFMIGFRFAKLYGFIETEEVINYSGKAYRIMRKV